jgi:hypothetical protein
MSRTITRAFLGEVRKDLEAAIKAVAEKHGIQSGGIGNITFDTNTFSTGRLQFGLFTQTPIISANQELMGKRFQMGQRIFTITEILPNGKVTGRTQRNKNYSIKVEQLSGMIAL